MTICALYIRTERSPTTTFPWAHPPWKACHATIHLHGRTYHCRREKHGDTYQCGGVHDAMVTGGDGYLVRW